jgi:nucleotide-binding universal stress UspA family protein
VAGKAAFFLRSNFIECAYDRRMKTPFFDIVVPVDGSATSHRAIEYAIGLSSDGVTLHFCTVASESPFVDSEENARNVCNDAVTLAANRGVTADARVLFGPVAPTVCRYATDVYADAIVIGTGARRGLARVLLGSVTDALLAICAIPVIVTHVDDLLRADCPITLAVDDSVPPRAALKMGVGLAKAAGLSLVIETVTGPKRADWRHAGDLLSDAADVARAADIEFELVTVSGRVAEAIVDDGEKRMSPAIIVGTGKHSPLARALFGSVAAVVLERAQLPVIVVPG